MHVTIDQISYVVVRSHMLNSSKEVGLWEAVYFKGCNKTKVLAGQKSVRLEYITAALTMADIRISRTFLDVQKLISELEDIGVTIVPSDKSNPDMTSAVLYAIDYLAYLNANMVTISA